VLVPEGRFYGFPEFGVPGFKFGKYHHLSEQVRSEYRDRVANAADEAACGSSPNGTFRCAGETLDCSVHVHQHSDEHFMSISTRPTRV